MSDGPPTARDRVIPYGLALVLALAGLLIGGLLPLHPGQGHLLGFGLVLVSGLLVAEIAVSRRASHRALRESEERLRQLEANAGIQAELARVAQAATIGALMASIAHEINQPLTAILSNASATLRWLAREPPELEEARAAIRRISDDGKRAGEIIQRTRNLTRGTPGSKEPVRLAELVQDAVALLASEAQGSGVSIEQDISPGVPPVLVDRIQIQQVLLELGQNAIESMRKVGEGARTLRFTSEAVDPARVEVTVADSGAGLEDGASQRLFDPFFSTKPNGMGMGLAISRSIIESHGGRIRASPGSPGGAVFSFDLPVAPGPG